MYWFFSSTLGAQRRYVPKHHRDLGVYLVPPDITQLIDAFKTATPGEILIVEPLRYQRLLVRLSPPNLRAMRTRAGADYLTPREFTKLSADIRVCEEFEFDLLYPVTTWVYYLHVP